MKIIKSFSLLFFFTLLLSSCSKDEQTEIVTLEQPLFEQLNFNSEFSTTSKALVEGVTDVRILYSKVYESETDMSTFYEPTEINQLIDSYEKVSKDDLTFSEIVRSLSNEIEVSNSEIHFLKEFDKLIFSANSIFTALENMKELDKSIQLSNSLSILEKNKLRQLNAVLYHGLSFQQQNSFLRTDWLGCLAGIGVTIGGGASANPLAVIAGAMIIDKYC